MSDILRLLLTDKDGANFSTVYDDPTAVPSIYRSITEPFTFQLAFEIGMMVGYAAQQKKRLRLHVVSNNTHVKPLVDYVNRLAGYGVIRFTKKADKGMSWLKQSPKTMKKAKPMRFSLLNGARPNTRFALVDFENVSLTKREYWMRYDRLFVVMGNQQEFIRLPSSFWKDDSAPERCVPIEVVSKTPTPTFKYKIKGQKTLRLGATRIISREKDALDRHLAFYVGVYCQLLGKNAIHIISNDKDYHPLIRYLQTTKKQLRFNQFHPNNSKYLFNKI